MSQGTLTRLFQYWACLNWHEVHRNAKSSCTLSTSLWHTVGNHCSNLFELSPYRNYSPVVSVIHFDKIERKIKGHWRERGESWSKDCFIVAFTDKKFKQCVMSKRVEGKNHFFLTESFKFRLNLQFMTSPTSNYFPYAHNVCFRVCLLNFNFKWCRVFPHWNLLKLFALKLELKE